MSAPSELFGRIVSGDDVEAAVQAALVEWLPTYLAQLALRHARNASDVPLPRSYGVMPELTRNAENQLPAIIIANAGVSDTPTIAARGVVTASWEITIGFFCTARDQNSTNLLVRWYAAAIRSIMLQQGVALADGQTIKPVWIGEVYDAVPGEDSRTFGVGRNVFQFVVGQCSEANAGPLSPAEDPTADDAYPPNPLVDSVIVEGDKL